MIATDEQFKNIYQGRQGLIIGRGAGSEYEHDPIFDKFNGIKIGCNSAYTVADLDVLVWMDSLFFVTHWQEIKQLKCLKFAPNPDVYNTYGVDVYELRVNMPERCSVSFDSGFYPCELSGYLALNIALLFGLNPIWLHGFTSEMNDNYGNKRADKFQYLANWAKQNNREIYLANKEGYVTKFFIYKQIEINSKKKKIAK